MKFPFILVSPPKRTDFQNLKTTLCLRLILKILGHSIYKLQFGLYQMLDIVANYHRMQFQGKFKIQT